LVSYCIVSPVKWTKKGRPYEMVFLENA